MKSYVKEDTVIVLCAKGIEVETGKMLSEVLQEEIPYATVAILSGPGFAVDVAKQKLASVTIACAKEGIASELANMLGTPYFRPYLTADMISPQIGGSVKTSLPSLRALLKGLNSATGRERR